jgi:hypothetical protein
MGECGERVGMGLGMGEWGGMEFFGVVVKKL